MSAHIPSISNRRIRSLLKRIRPVVNFAKTKTFPYKEDGHEGFEIRIDPRGKWSAWDLKGGIPHFIKIPHPRNTAYTWDPKRDKKATGIKKLRDITTHHAFSYYGFFKPSIAEVLAQIPSDVIDQVVAFEITNWPKDRDDLFGKFNKETNAGYHVATTRLYAKA